MRGIQQPDVFKQGLSMLATGVVVLAGSIAAWAYWGHHFWTALDGPTEVSLADIAKLKDPSELPSTWVKVKFDNAEMSEYVLEEDNAGVSYVTEEYLIFQAGDRWMLASVPRDFEGNEISGQIYAWSTRGLSGETLETITEELEDVHQGKMFPFQFSGHQDYGQNWMAFAGVIGFFALAGLFLGCFGFEAIFRSYREPTPEEYGFIAPRNMDENGMEPELAAATKDLLARISSR